MALIGKWYGDVIGTMQPSTSWAAPNGLFPTQSRNDGSTYTWTSSTSTLTLPSSGLADGYMVRASLEFEDTSNGSVNISGRIVKASGTGSMFSPHVSGYSRDTSEDRSGLNVVGFIASPSASATLQFEWIRDSDAPNATDGTVQSYIEVIPFYYDDIAIYTGTTPALLGGTTPTTVDIGTTVLAPSAGGRVGNVAYFSSGLSRYLVIGSVWGDGFSAGDRTQRVVQLSHGYPATSDLSKRSYFYARDAANDLNGAMVWGVTHNRDSPSAGDDIKLECFRGPGVAAGDGGGDVDGATPSVAKNDLLIITLPLITDVFYTEDGTGEQDCAVTGPVDLNVCRTGDIEHNDSASWTRASDTAMNAEVAMDALVGANAFTARETITATERWTARAHITVNGTEDAATRDVNFSRGNTEDSSQDCFGWGAQPGGLIALSSGDDVGVSVQEISGTEGGGADTTQPGTVGLWGINLDTLKEAAASASPSVSPSSSPSSSISPSVSPSASPSPSVAPLDAICWGEETPDAGEESKPWTYWRKPGGAYAELETDEWGRVTVTYPDSIYGLVEDTGDTSPKSFAVTRDKYGTGSGSVEVWIRGSATSFDPDNPITPTYEEYAAPITRSWRYVQLLMTGVE